MSLHLLPHAKIQPAFNRLFSEGTDRTIVVDRRQRTILLQLLDYVENTWIDSTIWSPSDWSAYMQQVTRIELGLNIFLLQFNRLLNIRLSGITIILTINKLGINYFR